MKTLVLLVLGTLSLGFTAPATRHVGPCDDPALIPASGSVVFVQMLAVNLTVRSEIIYQQFRAAPGDRIMFYREVPAGRYALAFRTISERGYRSCEDVQFTAEVK